METRVHLVLSLTFRVKLKQQKRATVINDQRSKYQKNSIVNCFTKGVIVSWRKKHATVCTEQKLKRKGSNFHREKMQKHIYIDAKRWVDDSPVGLSNQQRQQSASQIHKKIFTNTKWWVDGGSMGLSGQQRQPSASHGLPSGIAKARGNSSYMLPFYLTIQPINIPMDTTCKSTFSLVWKLVPCTMYRYCASSLTKYGWKMKGQGDHLVPSAIGWQDWQLGVVSSSDGEIKYREGKCSWPLHFPRQCNPMPPTASSLGLRGELQKLEVQKLNLTHAMPIPMPWQWTWVRPTISYVRMERL